MSNSYFLQIRTGNFQNLLLLQFLPAILHDVSSDEKSTTHKGQGCCYPDPTLPSSGFLTYGNGFLFCVYNKLIASIKKALIGV